MVKITSSLFISPCCENISKALNMMDTHSVATGHYRSTLRLNGDTLPL